MEFSNAGEAYVVETALEVRRSGHWLLPTLQNEPRIAKPPMPAWIAAVSISRTTLQQIASADPAVRVSGYGRLAREVRLPALLAACLMLAAIAGLGHVISTSPEPSESHWRASEPARLREGLVIARYSALIAATSFLFLRFAPAATTDIHLALWVTVAELFLALALLQGRRWLGCVGAGAAMGLAFMSKGPVALIQAVAPIAVFAAWLMWTRRSRLTRGRWGAWLVPVVVGTALALLIGGWWYLLIMFKLPGVLHRWKMELSLDDETTSRAGGNPIYTYWVLLPLMAPWVVFFIGGLIEGLRSIWHGLEPSARRTPEGDSPAASGSSTFAGASHEVEAGATETEHPIVLGYASPDVASVRRSKLLHCGVVLAFCWAVVPVLVMSLVADRKARYLLPMAGPAAVLSALSLGEYLLRRQRDSLRLAGAVHWVALVAMGVGAPLAGLLFLKRAGGEPWYSVSLTASFVVGAVVLLMTGGRLSRRRPGAMAWTTALLMMALYILTMYGYRDSEEGRSQFRLAAEFIRQTSPDAKAWMSRPGRKARLPAADLAIYLNRPVLRAGDPIELQRDTVDQVVVYRQRAEDPLPELPPPWQNLKTLASEGDLWHILMLPRTPSADR